MDKAKNSLFSIFDIIIIVIAGIYILGLHTWFKPCDSTLFVCNTAAHVLRLLSYIMCALAVLHLIPSKMFKTGIDVGLLCIISLSAYLPGNVLSLCVLNTMRCRSYMQPWSFAFCACLALICIIDLVINVFQTIKRKK